MGKKFWQFMFVLGWINLIVALLSLLPLWQGDVQSWHFIWIGLIELVIGGVFVTVGRYQLSKLANGRN